MAGARLEINLDDEEVTRAFNALLRNTMSLKRPFQEIGASLVTSTQQRIEDEKTPEGKPFVPLAASTQAKRISRNKTRGADHILRLRGYLYSSMTYRASDLELAEGSNRRYAALQQFGGTSDMAPGPAAVPARPYLGVSDADEREIATVLLEHLQGGVV